MPCKFKDFFESRELRSQSPLLTLFMLTSKLSEEFSSSATVLYSLLVLLSQMTTNPQTSSAPIKKGQNYGIKELYDAGTEARINIMFMHELTGNVYNTWVHKDTGVHWPSELLRQDMQNAQILSFNYNADIMNIWNSASNSQLSNHAENMVDSLVQKWEKMSTESRKVLFVAHNLSELFTEHALSYSRNTAEKHLHQIKHCMIRIVFLEVSHCESDLASWANFETWMVDLFKRANSNIIEVLRPGSEMLRMMKNGFHNILKLRKNKESEISITCFFEELNVTGVEEVWLSMNFTEYWFLFL